MGVLGRDGYHIYLSLSQLDGKTSWFFLCSGISYVICRAEEHLTFQ